MTAHETEASELSRELDLVIERYFNGGGQLSLDQVSTVLVRLGIVYAEDVAVVDSTVKLYRGEANNYGEGVG